ncbi:protein CUSTOS-like [Patella vulgata]|uniref:protein CUSTOS-like n=1 Tax=Patella vulgata TaxID=6465 RepID=UPI0024A7BA5E|nr:protein CUSTOS-like [Patella vulgata]
MSSSESDNEETRRLKEAAISISTTSLTSNGHDENGHALLNGFNRTACRKISKRISNTSKEEDNELKTTPEFRSFVAKKLGAFLDSNTKCWTREGTDNDLNSSSVDDSGFRLFSSSCGDWISEEEANKKFCQRRRKRQKSSSSDSTEDDRLAEAVVPEDFMSATSNNKHEKNYNSLEENSPSKKQKKCKHKTKEKDADEQSGIFSLKKHKKKKRAMSGD